MGSEALGAMVIKDIAGKIAPLARATGAISSSIQLLIDHFDLDGGFLVERATFSRARVSGQVLLTFGKSYGIIAGDDIRISSRQGAKDSKTPRDQNGDFLVSSPILPSLLFMEGNDNPQWLEVNRSFLVGPIQLMTALSVMPEMISMPEHQLILFDTRPSPTTSREISSALLGIGPLLAKVIESSHTSWAREAVTSQVLSQAERDPLTGVLNRFGWERALEVLKNSDPGLDYTIVAFDLDNLKIINDSSGHASGDVYIRRFAEILRSICRSNDIIARLGGDEFVLLAPKMTPPGARDFARRLEGQLIQAGVFVSMGHACDKTPLRVQELLSVADKMMYSNKKYKKTIAMTGSLFGTLG